MKGFRFYLLALPLAMVFCVSSLSAQAPDGQLGIQAGTAGFGIQYAISPSLQIGTILGLLQGDAAVTSIGLTPYAKFLFEGVVNPYIMAGATIEVSDNGTASSTSTSLGAAFGLEYYANNNVGVFGQVGFIEIGLDPSATFFGIFNGHVGVEWFFNQ